MGVAPGIRACSFSLLFAIFDMVAEWSLPLRRGGRVSERRWGLHLQPLLGVVIAAAFHKSFTSKICFLVILIGKGSSIVSASVGVKLGKMLALGSPLSRASV